MSSHKITFSSPSPQTASNGTVRQNHETEDENGDKENEDETKLFKNTLEIIN